MQRGLWGGGGMLSLCQFIVRKKKKTENVWKMDESLYFAAN